MTSSVITHTPGRFVWHELLTPDTVAAQRFYGDLFGWTFEAFPMGPDRPPYQMISAPAVGTIGGMMPIPAGQAVPPHWAGYVSVLDVDAAAVDAEAAGGRVAHPPTDIPNVGRFAVIVDPQGGVSYPFKSTSGDNPDGVVPSLGMFCWDQLNASDPDAAATFYAAVYGWTRAAFMGADLPELTIFGRAGGQMAGSLMPAPAGVPAHWLSYVVVSDLAATRAKAVAGGGNVMVELIAVPGQGDICVLQDPQGVVICAFASAS